MGHRNLSKKYAYLALIIFVILNSFALLYAISNLSISYNEAEIFFAKDSFISCIANFSTYLFGQNDYALRLPFLIIYLINIFLMFKVSKKNLKRNSDRFLNIILFMCLPGVMSSAILLNPAGIIVMISLLCIYFDQENKKILFFITLCASIFVDKAFLILYISVFIYGFINKKQSYVIISFILLILSLYFYDYEISGKPRGFLLDVIGVFSATFSPLVNLLFLYSMYRILIKGQKKLIFYISFIPLIYCLIFSIRQRIDLENFLPFCVVSSPLMIQTFLHSYRIRLPKFRKFHKVSFLAISIFLTFNYFVTIFNQSLYVFFKNHPKSHFIYKYDVAKQLASNLKTKRIYEINSFDDRILKRLKFYGINQGNKNFLYGSDEFFAKDKILIKKYDIIIAIYFIF